jgi:AcrR family transcriptional regulator
MILMSISQRRSRPRVRPLARDPNYGAFSFPAHLRDRLKQAASAPKTARTRLRLMMAMAELLEEDGFHALRVADIAARADLAHGTFYRYWPDRHAAVQDLLSDFMAAIRTHRQAALPDSGFHDRLVASNRYYVRVYRANSGLMRCLMQLGNQDAEFARIGQAANLALAARVVRAWERAAPEATATLTSTEKTARALACIAMVEGVLRDLHVRPGLDPLASLADDAVADLLSACWFRILFGREPPAMP